jgi:hypothetical protein
MSLCHAAAAGVWRSHSCCLQLPLQQPANVAAAALQLPGGAVALSITLSLEPNACSSLLLLEAALRPQYGLMLSGSGGSSASGGLGLGSGGPCLGEVLPMRVLPGGSAGLCFMLMQDQGGSMVWRWCCCDFVAVLYVRCVGVHSVAEHLAYMAWCELAAWSTAAYTVGAKHHIAAAESSRLPHHTATCCCCCCSLSLQVTCCWQAYTAC